MKTNDWSEIKDIFVLLQGPMGPKGDRGGIGPPGPTSQVGPVIVRE